MEWLFLFLGLPIGIAAARANVFIDWAAARIKYGKVRLRGAWAEWVSDPTGRQYSIGVIEYSIFRRRYNFDGTNYLNDGTPYCHWKTVSSYLDLENGQFHYVFSTTQVGALQASSYGYGVVNLIRRDGIVAPQDGYYIYATTANNAVLVSHTMMKIESAPHLRTANVSRLLEATFPAEWELTSSTPNMDSGVTSSSQ